MFYNAKDYTIKIDNTDMDYVSFGKGSKNLIIIPGLGDGLKTVKGMSIPLAMMFKMYAKDYKVYVFSRINQLPTNYSTKDMASDVAKAMKKLRLNKCCVMGISQGGMISQYLTIDYPELVEKLVLVVTLCKPNDTSKKVINSWIELAKENNFKDIFIDTSEKTYTEKKLKTLRPFYPLLARFSKPKNLDRFIIQATACYTHDSSKEIGNIKCPTLIIGGNSDKIVGSYSSKEISEYIENSKLKIYDGLGHSTYEEAKDFNNIVLEFFNS